MSQAKAWNDNKNVKECADVVVSTLLNEADPKQVQQVLRSAEQWVERKRQKGWTQKHFARGLKRLLTKPTTLPKPKADLGFSGQGSGYNIGDNTAIGVAGGGG